MKKQILKQLSIIAITAILVNCNNSEVAHKETINASIAKTEINDSATIYDLNYLKLENVLVNEQPIILSKKEFETRYKEIDSTYTEVWECGSPFEGLDEKWMEETYGKRSKETGTFPKFNGEIKSIYTNEIKYNSNGHIFLFETTTAHKINFKIKSHAIVLNESTTQNEFSKLFPNLKAEPVGNQVMYGIDVNEGSFESNLFYFYFDNNKLIRVELWWLLC